MTSPQPPEPPPVTIVLVELLDQSWATYRELNGGHPARYPVAVWLSRLLDSYERNALAVLLQNFSFTDDPRKLVLVDTTLEQVRDQLGMLNGRLASAATAGSRTRANAEAENDRLAALAEEINRGLQGG